MHPIDSFAPAMLLIILLGLAVIVADALVQWSLRKVRDEQRRTREEGEW